MINSGWDHVVGLVHALVANSDLLFAQVRESGIWLFRNRIIIKMMNAVCLSEMFKPAMCEVSCCSDGKRLPDRKSVV
jgi:hypothetical protein